MSDKKLTSLLEIINYSAGLLKENNIKDARLNIELMFCEILKCDRIKLYLDFDKPLKQEEIAGFKAMLKRRLNHEPLQYIIGKTNFYGCNLLLNNKVLIPRQETEILVGKVLEDVFESGKENVRILEIGSGSGCIAIALSSEMKKKNILHNIVSIDNSTDSISISNENMKLNNISDENINFKVIDYLKDDMSDNKFDYIVSNPPYIPSGNLPDLDAEVKNYEPVDALTDGKDGLLFYEIIFNLCKSSYSDSKIFLEIGDGQKNKIEELLNNLNIRNFRYFKDYNKIDRVLKIN